MNKFKEQQLIIEKTARQLELINPIEQPEQLRMLLNEMKEAFRKAIRNNF